MMNRLTVIRRWKLYVCGDCGRAAGDGSHQGCDLNARDRVFDVVLACAYDALREQQRGAVSAAAILAVIQDDALDDSDAIARIEVMVREALASPDPGGRS